jgi:hypothetical protein
MVPMAMAMASGTLQQQLVACGTRRQAWALLFLLPLAAAQQKPLRPSHAMINLTLFHVGVASCVPVQRPQARRVPRFGRQKHEACGGATFLGGRRPSNAVKNHFHKPTA